MRRKSDFPHLQWQKNGRKKPPKYSCSNLHMQKLWICRCFPVFRSGLNVFEMLFFSGFFSWQSLILRVGGRKRLIVRHYIEILINQEADYIYTVYLKTYEIFASPRPSNSFNIQFKQIEGLTIKAMRLYFLQ